MVNFGISRACDTCKRRRKKCDETRPACLRCVKSRHPCPGYKDDSSLLFRHYSPRNQFLYPTLERWSPNADYMLEAAAADIFLDELVVRSLDRNQSRGFLDGMHATFAASAPKSTLMSAAKIVVLASLANRYRRQSLFNMVRKQYGQLLWDYMTSLSLPSETLSPEQFFTSVLLGLYELMSSNRASPTRHLVHVQGLGSILQRGISSPPSTSHIGVHLPGTWLISKGAVLSRNRPVDICSADMEISQTHTQGSGILCPPLDDNPQRSLDQIMVRLAPLTARTEQLLANANPSRSALLELYEALIVFHDEIALWADFQPPAWRPELIGYVSPDSPTAGDIPWICSGPVEKYFDLYVGTAWNSWRSMYIVWLDQLYHVSNALGQHDLIPHYVSTVESLVAGLKASIPYHLSRNVQGYIKHVNAGVHDLQINHLSGGLLLFHHLYSIGRCTVVAASTRQYLANVLKWIGNEMGIGNAAVLADCLRPDEQGPSVMQNSKISFMDALEGYYLITASMLSKSV
ncbi:hypothetical protein FLAG1_08471 [Fusarium langsethiae]|uniref:Zn(2)-C6 fungal-type domain-containing protein n=1 Tax=Fusarium langsethiae TaxID=179993 RepID=A0A0M9ESN9_FUSLA|nr:hypothetical protein FLAG1_08471 [Fusarium langsethiae]GKU05580.1 unnamed protein product [Fusarium langsethiae]GKU09760.1 unnamed protein product [Fusarium langsethiae]